MDAVLQVPPVHTEPVCTYAPGSRERATLEAELARVRAEGARELPMVIAGRAVMAGGAPIDVVEPHRHAVVLGRTAECTRSDVDGAVRAAGAAAREWRAMDFADRASIFLRAAALLAGPWRDRLNAATMLGQSKTVQQAEIDAACELIDFFRFNVANATRLFTEQPNSPAGEWNVADYRPLEGFVLAISPFNFTSIAANLPAAPALMGNVVVWKPSPTQQLAASVTMELLAAAGLPPGVVNMVTGNGAALSEIALPHRDLAGIHFTGSTATFEGLWRGVAENISGYRSYPRIVGETGGKDFVVAHSSADVDALRIGLVRGAFEYQGQKCSAASRAYLARSVWTRLRTDLAAEVEALSMGDPTDLRNFMGAVIDRRAFDKHRAVLERAAADPAIEVLAGGTAHDEEGFFVRPTVLVCDDPGHEIFRTEYFGPILAVYVYDDADPGTAFGDVLDLVDGTSPYGLTGAIFADDRAAARLASDRLRFAAGNFYVNDKPTGAVVMAQPFGGSRRSGTDDKAGSILNLWRWVSARSVKETFVPSTSVRYPHMG